ncbi:hypothetical protein [Streptomyces sp. S1]|uniref:hypothetical protein n=1 Tax=Streptomyces sp. S1 TaxID=718288 RepID=UPI003D71D601
MPRRRPGALRARRVVPRRLYAGTGPWPDERVRHSWPVRMAGLSSRTVSAIQREECRRPDDEELWFGATREALDAYRWFLSLPGRYLYLRLSVCGCAQHELGENTAVARDLLDLVVRRLPPRPRRELEALLTRLDDELRRRTLPDPFAHRRPHRGEGWWHRRLYDETAHL